MLIVIGGSKTVDTQQGNLRNSWTRRRALLFKWQCRFKICSTYKIGPGSSCFNEEAKCHWLSDARKAMKCFHGSNCGWCHILLQVYQIDYNSMIISYILYIKHFVVEQRVMMQLGNYT